MRNKQLIYTLWAVFSFFALIGCGVKRVPFQQEIGKAVDSLHGVKVYFNGPISHVDGRNTTADGYNLGLKYQCVEFVKRYYYEYLHHKMPNAYGNAKDFFDQQYADGRINKDRGLIQHTNPSETKPEADDLVVFDGNAFNPYGHVAIISSVSQDKVEIIQQNPGPFASSRIEIGILFQNGLWKINRSDCLGWLSQKSK